jgi:hypothetical protein
MLFYVTVFLIVNNMTLSISCKRFTENKLLTYLLLVTMKVLKIIMIITVVLTIIVNLNTTWGKRWHSWLRQCTTSQKVAGSIPDGVDSASNRNEYQEYFLWGKGSWCIGLTTLPPLCAYCHEIWELQPPGTPRACNRPAEGLLHLYLYILLVTKF